MVRQHDADTATALDLVTGIYEAAATPGLWPRFLDAFAYATQSDAAMIWLRDTGSPDSVHRRAEPELAGDTRFDATCLAHYAEHSRYVNALLEVVHTLAEGTVVTAASFAPQARVRGSGHCCAGLRSRAVPDVLGGAVLKRGSTVAVFSASRNRRYGERERTLLEQLLPHLRRACLLHTRLARLDVERSRALAALDLLPTAIWVLDAHGRMVFANRMGRDLDHRRDGLWLQDDGSPWTCDPNAQQALRRIVTNAINSGMSGTPNKPTCAGALRIPRRRSATTLQVMVYPLPRDTLTQASAAAIFIFDPEHAAIPDESVLRSFYGLTRTESQLAATLSRGDSLDDYCRANEVSANTARTHLKSVLAKTGTHRQAQLVSLLASTSGTAPPHVAD